LSPTRPTIQCRRILDGALAVATSAVDHVSVTMHGAANGLLRASSAAAPENHLAITGVCRPISGAVQGAQHVICVTAEQAAPSPAPS
jgi:hypothetical protein